MKKSIWFICNGILASVGLLVLGVSVLPLNTAIAQTDEEDCNRFGAKCYVSGVNTIHTEDDSVSSGLLDTIKNAINWILGILATVALCICMYGGFKMLTSGGDSKGFDAGKTVLKNAALGLAIILLAWMIVSLVFRFVGTLSGGNQTQGSGVSPTGPTEVGKKSYPQLPLDK